MKMLVKRAEIQEVESFKLGDKIKFTLSNGEPVRAIAVKEVTDGMVFITVDCLRDEEPMNEECTNDGGYEACNLRKKLNGEILDKFPSDMKDRFIPFANGDLLRLPTEKEIFGKNFYGEEEPESVLHFPQMTAHRNHIAFRGHNGDREWYWLQNPVEGSASYFAFVSYGGGVSYFGASYSLGVRPCFKLEVKT
jgi:hypothetical protein